jgi:hypothetical protein
MPIKMETEEEEEYRVDIDIIGGSDVGTKTRAKKLVQKTIRKLEVISVVVVLLMVVVIIRQHERIFFT